MQAAGLANLNARKYRAAARKFIETPPELGNSYASLQGFADTQHQHPVISGPPDQPLFHWIQFQDSAQSIDRIKNGSF